jgi:hypothetical protein
MHDSALSLQGPNILFHMRRGLSHLGYFQLCLSSLDPCVGSIAASSTCLKN